jgi:hypothetical protein
MAVMTKQGIRSFEAVTQLQALFNAFIKPSNELTEAFKEFGIESGSVLAQTKGLSGILEFLQESTGGNIEAMGKLLPNVRALKGALALTGQQAKNFSDTLMLMDQAAGSTQTAFEKQELTFETLGNQVNKLQIRIGQAFLPVLFEMSELMEGFTKTMELTAPAISILISAIKALAGPALTSATKLITEIKDSFGDLTPNIVKTVSVFDILAPLIKLVAINFDVGVQIVRMFISTLLDIVKIGKEAVDTLVLLAQAIFQPKKWKEVGEQIKLVGDSIKDFTLGVIANTSELITNTVKSYAELPESAKGLSREWSQIWKNAINDVETNFEDGSMEMESTFQGSMSRMAFGLQSFTAEATKETKKWTGEMLKDLGSKMGKVLGIIQFVATQIANTMKQAMSIAMDDLRNQMDKNIDDIKKWNDN